MLLKPEYKSDHQVAHPGPPFDRLLVLLKWLKASSPTLENALASDLSDVVVASFRSQTHTRLRNLPRGVRRACRIHVCEYMRVHFVEAELRLELLSVRHHYEVETPRADANAPAQRL